MDVLVVGAGEMGRWFGRVLVESADEPVALAFADTDTDAAASAASARDATTVSSPSDSRHDLVCIAVPIPAAVQAIEQWAPAATDAVLDLTGTMTEPVAALAAHAPDRERISIHPLFAPANEPGNVAVVSDADGPRSETVRTALAARGNDLYETTPAEHDEAMRTVQARTHAAVLAFGLVAEPVPEGLQTPISAELTDLVAQVTDGDPQVYAEIQAAFSGADDVADAAGRLAAADAREFARLYEDADPER